MIDFDEEISKYEYILTIEEVEQKVMSETKQNDVVKLLEMINSKLESTKE